MADNEQTRSQYLQALLNQRKTFNASGNNLVNPSVSNNVEDLALQDTNFQQGVSNANVPTEEDIQKNQSRSDDNILSDISSFFYAITEGFFSGVEGILDSMVLTPIAKIGEWTGNDMSSLRNFIQTDLSEYAIGSLWNSMETGDWNQFVYSPSFEEYNSNRDKYMYHSHITSDVGKFFEGAGSSIGFMLPSIITGVASGGSSLVSLSTMGLGAGGQAEQSALQEGATFDQAIGYGVLSGGAEVLSELAVGPILAKVGLGSGKIFGVFGGKTVKTTSKSFINKLVKDAFEEGMEEVSTALIEPLIKSIYKGQEALDEYKDPAKFFLGVGGNFNESVLGQFASGAFTGGIMSGVNNYTQIKHYGKSGVSVIENYGDYMENVAKSLKYDKGTPKYNKAVEDAMSAYGKLVESWNDAQSKLSDTQLNNLRSALSNPAELFKSVDVGSKNFIDYKINQLNTINKAQSYKVFSDITRSAGTSGYILEFAEMGKNDYASVDHTNKIVKLNSKYEGRYGADIAHDYISHVIIDQLGGQEKVNSLYDRIKNSSFYSKYSDSLNEQYKTKDENYQQMIANRQGELAEDYFKREVVANYIGNVVYNKGGNFTQLKYVKSLFEKEGIFKKLINKFKGVKTNNTIMNEVKTLIKNVASSNKNSMFKSVIKKLENGVNASELTEKERVFYNANKGFFKDIEGLVFNSHKLTTYTKSQFKKFGWVMANNILTGNEYSQFNDFLSDAKLNGRIEKVDGFDSVTTYDDNSHKASIILGNGFTNKSGNYTIDKVITFNKIYDEADFEFAKNEYVEMKNLGGITNETKYNIIEYSSKDLGSDGHYRRYIENTKNSGRSENRGRNSQETRRVEEVETYKSKKLTKNVNLYSKQPFYYTDGDNAYKAKIIKTEKGFTVETTNLETAEIKKLDFKSMKSLISAMKGKTSLTYDKSKALEIYNKAQTNTGKAFSTLEVSERNGSFKQDKLIGKYTYDMSGSKKGVIQVSRNTSEKGGFVVSDSGVIVNLDFSGANAREKVAKFLKDSNAVGVRGKNFNDYETNASFKRDSEKYRQSLENKSEIVEETKQTTKKVEQTSEKQAKNIRKTKENTDNYVRSITNVFKTVFGADYKAIMPKSFSKFASVFYTTVNSSNVTSTQIKRCMELLKGVYVNQYNAETRTDNVLGTVGELATQEQLNSLSDTLKSFIENNNIVSKNGEIKSLEVTNERNQSKVKEVKETAVQTKTLVNQRRIVKDVFLKDAQIVENDIAKYGYQQMWKPIQELKSIEGGFSSEGVRENFEALRQEYSKIKEQPVESQVIPYEPEVEDLITNIIDSLGQSVDGTNARLGGETTKLIKEYARIVSRLVSKTKVNLINKILPSVAQAKKQLKISKYGVKKNVLAKAFRSYKRGFAPSYVILSEMFGGASALTNTLVQDTSVARNTKDMYVGEYQSKIRAELKRLNLLSKYDSTKIEFKGNKLSLDQALYLYNSLQVEANFNAINNSGLGFYNKNGNVVKLVDVGEAENIKAELEHSLTSEQKEFANFLLNTMNGSVKAEYIEFYKQRFGAFRGTNEIGEINENKYWTLMRDTYSMSSVETAVKNPDAIFSSSKARVNNKNMVLIGGALSNFDYYIDKLSTELYLKPVYRDALTMLNYGKEDSIYYELKGKVDPQDLTYLKNTMSDMVGALDNKVDMVQKISSMFSVSKLALNIGSSAKQFLSLFTSNLPLSKSFQAFIKSRITDRAEFSKEMKMLLGEVDGYEGIGGLKYRAGTNAVVEGNVGKVNKTIKKITNVTMFGIKAVDLFTIKSGVYTLMLIGEAQEGAKIGTKANYDFVVKHWSDFELSQVGSSSLSKSGVHRGDYGSMTRAIFSLLQGANRACLGSQINKFDLYNRNKSVNKSQLLNEQKNATKALEDFKNSKSIDGQFDVRNLSEEDAQKYIELQSNKIDVDLRVKDFQKFEVAGGKKIPLNMAGGLVIQGLFATLINELMKHLKGKKDWDDWDLLEIGTSTAMAMFLDWIPLVNTFTSIGKGYDVQVPAVAILNEISAISKYIQNGNTSALVRELATFLGDFSGIPFTTVYEYIYGMVKTFNPAIAYDMNSVFYGSTIGNATKTLNKYVAKGDERNTLAMVNVCMNNYRVQTSEVVAKEITNLLLAGEKDVMPKQYMTSYVAENGTTVELTSEQVKQFRQFYDLSDKEVSSAISSSEYKGLSNTQRSKLLKKIYDAYYGFAKYKVLGFKPSSKLEKLLCYTNGNVDLAKYLVYLQKIGDMTEEKNKTRKEVVASYINKLPLTKNEKTLLMYLAGFSPNDNNKKSLETFLRSKGASPYEIGEML